ncbi:alpha/beta hydrolase [Mucilaginibacter myungsuensis]|uniref:Alpha/beta hydrolase n=2 Tax=Mucilaginibacter myungsuensis TaxID=649104 RepID=A0A929PYZ1_9SPHI|nr:alpha/beta hydrolase [Mucilaginibacter myungsuensis]MBE9664669.1 alpha/beta hydrolase [Mucilaginibacter myungsuensis]
MKRSFMILCTVLYCFAVKAQTKEPTTYKTAKGISYYADTTTLDQYARITCKLDIYYPTNIKNFPTVIWFHGGGLTGGGLEVPKALMEKGFAVIGVGYRLSPKVKAPAYINDATAATAWAFKHIAEYGGRNDLIFMSGHSAGGYLDMMVTLDKSNLAAYGIDANKIAGLIPFSSQCITHFTVRKEEGIAETQPAIDGYAPLQYIRADAPPTILITGDREMELLGRYEENAYTWRVFKLKGHKNVRLYELQGYDHGGMAEPAFPMLVREVRALTKAIVDPKSVKK